MFLLAQSIEEVSRVAAGDNYTVAGVLFLLLLAVGYAVYRISSWLGCRLDKVMDRGFQHLDTVDATMASLKDSIGGVGTRLDGIEGKLNVVDGKVDVLGERVNHLDSQVRGHKGVA